MQILKIRFYQFKRDLGFLFFVFIVALAGLSYFLFQSYKQVGLYVAIAIIYLIYSFHKSRRDIVFMHKHFDSARKQIIVEYQLFLLPVSLPCLFTDYNYCFFIIHVAGLLIPVFEVKTKLRLKLSFLSKWFGKDYIFVSGFRRNFVLLSLIFALALLLSPLKLFPLIALFIFNLVIFSFYEGNECVQLLQSFNLSPKKLLFHFFRSAFLKMIIPNGIVLIINICFNPEVLEFNLFFIGYNTIMLLTVIAMKYSNYDHRNQQGKIQVKLILMTLGLFMPYLAPLTIVFYFQSRVEAINNLNRYLDDHD